MYELSKGETLIGRKFYTRCGGKGANQAVAITKLALNKNAVRFVSTIGDDSNGMDLLSNFKRVGMNTECVIVCENISTGVATICIDEKGENSIIVVPGANACFSPSVVRVKIEIEIEMKIKKLTDSLIV